MPQEISKFAKILGHQKGSTFGSVYNVFASSPSPNGEKYPNLLKSWGIKRVNFWLSIQCFCVFTITPWREISKFAKILGHQKGSTFGSVYNVFASSPSPHGEKHPNLLKSWGIKKGQLLAQYTMFLRLQHHPMARNIQIC